MSAALGRTVDAEAADRARAAAAARISAAPAPLRVRMGRIVGLCALLLALEAGGTLSLGQHLDLALHIACGTVMVVFALVFCVYAVTVAGFIAGLGAGGMVLLEPGWLLPLLGGAVLLALACGIAPGWARVEYWQSLRSAPLTALEEAAVSQLPVAPGQHGRLRATGHRLASCWRADRVFAAFLVLVYPPLATAGAVAFTAWTVSHR